MIENLYPGELPIGSIDERRTNIIGRGGSIRHSGSFSDSNPYYQQLKHATKNQDMDALYERAVEWESDQANYLQQLDTNRKILEEQREYDLPENEIRRMREAGINPDIQGSSGSGSGSGSGSASMSVPAMADQQGQTKFSNAYDNTNLVFSGINTAVGVIGGITNGFSSIMSSLDLLATLPSRKSLSNAQANLFNAEAKEIRELLDGKKISTDISNRTGILNQLAGLTDLISMDATDDSIISTLSSLGFSEDDEVLSNYKDIIKQFHSNPEVKAKYYTNTLTARQQREYNNQYTDQILNRITTNAIRVQSMSQEFDLSQMRLDKALNDYLYNAGYAEAAGEATMEQQYLTTQGAELSKIQLERELQIYYQGLIDIADAVREQDRTIEQIYRGCIDPKTNTSREPTGAEQGIIDACEANKKALNMLGIDKFEQINMFARHAQKLRYGSEVMLNRYGHMETTIGMDRHNYFMNFTWDDIVNNTVSDSEVIGGLTKTIIGVATAGITAGAASGAVRGARGVIQQGFRTIGKANSPVANGITDVNAWMNK